jgi:hypothetical protein
LRIPATSLALVLVLAGCMTGGRPANDPAFHAAIRTYYNANAAEAGCTAPTLTSFESLNITGSLGLGTMQMRSTHFFEERDPATGESICRGSGERSFTVVRTAEGATVLAMTGPKRPPG